jgi:hypothetical protein
VGRENLQGFVEVWFSNFFNYWRTRLLFIVASRGITTRGQDVTHVGMFVGTSLTFHFNEIGLKMRLRPHGKVDKLYGLVMGFHS